MTRLATRIGLGFGVSLLTLVLVIAVTFYAFETARRSSAEVHENHIPSIEAAATLWSMLERMDNLEYLYLSADKDNRQWLRQYDETAEAFEGALHQAEQVVVTPEEAAIYAELVQQYGAFQHINGRLRALAAKGRWAEARSLNATESLQAEIAFREAGRRFFQLNLEAADRYQIAEQRTLAKMEALALAVALAGVLTAAYRWRRVTSDIVAPLDALRLAASELAAGGRVGPRHPAAEKTEELAVLQNEFHHMAAELDRSAVALRTANEGLEAQVAERTAELVAAKERLEALVQELQAVDRLKSDFLDITSHELLTPIAFIVGFASSLDDGLMGPLNAQQREATAKILEGAERLTRMVRNTLEFSRAEAGHLSVYLEPVDVDEVVRHVAAAFEERAEAHEQELSVAIDDDLPPIMADPDRLTQVLSEILDNAVKFTPAGGRIQVRASASEAWVVCEVTDSGPGIPPDAMNRLYQPFFQVDSSKTRAQGGLGLGLPLARHIARRMGGDLQVRSRIGRGTTFRVLFPRADAEAARK